MGLYIGGNAIGGMSGRLITGVLSDFVSWHTSLLIMGLIALGAAGLFWKFLPPSRNFRPNPLNARNLLEGFVLQFRDAGLPLLFLEGFLLMGAFVTLFNYIGYRLLADPYNLSQALDRPPRDQSQGPGVLAVPVQLLRRLKRGGHRRWRVLALRRLERHRRVHRPGLARGVGRGAETRQSAAA
nr:hypothetical protein [Tanacetum cinerariifolium]